MSRNGEISILGEGTSVNGVIETTHNLEIRGSFEGEINCGSDLFIEENAEVTAEIRARNVSVGGTVEGNIICQNSLTIVNTGKVLGNIKVNLLKIEEGAIFKGDCEMTEAQEEAALIEDEADSSPAPIEE